MPLDPIGNISLTLQIVILFLLIMGLPFMPLGAGVFAGLGIVIDPAVGAVLM